MADSKPVKGKRKVNGKELRIRLSMADFSALKSNAKLAQRDMTVFVERVLRRSGALDQQSNAAKLEEMTSLAALAVAVKPSSVQPVPKPSGNGHAEASEEEINRAWGVSEAPLEGKKTWRNLPVEEKKAEALKHGFAWDDVDRCVRDGDGYRIEKDAEGDWVVIEESEI